MVPLGGHQEYSTHPGKKFRYAARGYVYQKRRSAKAAVAVDTVVVYAVEVEDTATIALNVDANAGQRQRLMTLTSMMLQRILTWYYLFLTTKTFSFLQGVGVVRGWGRVWGEESYTPYPSNPTNCHTLLGGKEGYLFISLSLSLIYVNTPNR